MKSPTKQDFIEENHEEGIEIQRKIRVKILDPDATESSSDDEQEKRPKFIVHEIIQEKVKIQSLSQKNKTPLDFYQFSGKLPPMIRKRKCGKFVTEEKLKVAKNANEVISAKSEIGSSGNPPIMVDSQTSDSSKVKTCFDQYSGKLPPMVRKRKCGKFATEEKLKVAKNVIVKKVISAKSEIGCSSSDLPLMVDSQTSDLSKVKTRFDLFCGKLPPMVRKRKSGKFCTEIRDPFSKKRIWLGTFDTPEEASEVYQSKKLEFEKLKKSKNAKNANVKRVISAKSFDTAEEASEVYQSKKFEFEEKLKRTKTAKVKKAISAKSELGSSSRNSPLMVDTQTSDSSKVKIQSFSLKKRKSLSFDQLSGKLPHMVSKRKSGKFGTEIRDPFSKKRIWLGTFNTAEEASEAFQSKKFEFEERLKKAKNANVKRASSAKFELGSFSSDLPLMVDSQTSDSSKKAKNANVKKVISAKSELGSSCGDLPLMVDSQNTDSSNEFDVRLKKVKDANVKKVIFAKSELGFSSSDPPLMVYSQTSDSSNELDDQLKRVINAKGKKAISAKFDLVSSSSSDPSLTVDSQTSDSSNGQESEEEMWMGQWIRISGDKEVKFSQKLGVPVVDNYGFLLGEFSKLDDLSISI